MGSGEPVCNVDQTGNEGRAHITRSRDTTGNKNSTHTTSPRGPTGNGCQEKFPTGSTTGKSVGNIAFSSSISRSQKPNANFLETDVGNPQNHLTCALLIGFGHFLFCLSFQYPQKISIFARAAKKRSWICYLILGDEEKQEYTQSREDPKTDTSSLQFSTE